MPVSTTLRQKHVSPLFRSHHRTPVSQSFRSDVGTYCMHHLRVVIHNVIIFLLIIIYYIRHLGGRLMYGQINIIIQIIETIFALERIPIYGNNEYTVIVANTLSV